MCHCLDKACISWGLAAQDHSNAMTSCHPVIIYVREVHLKLLIKFTSCSFGEKKQKQFSFRVGPICPMLRSSEGLRLLDLIFRRQRPSMIVKKSQDEKPEKPRNDSVSSAGQESGKPQCLHRMYKQGKDPTRQKTKSGGLVRGKKRRCQSYDRRVRTSHGNVATAKLCTEQPKATGVTPSYPRWVEKPRLGVSVLSQVSWGMDCGQL